MTEKVNLYLKRAEELDITPNFFMSVPYLVLSKVKAVIQDGWIWLEDGGQFVVPPLPLKLPVGAFPSNDVWILPYKDIWASFPVYQSYICGRKKELLDVQYIFNPKDFLTMTGSHWETFRKNSKKVVKRFTGKQIMYVNPPQNNTNRTNVGLLIGTWMEERMETLEDAEFMADFAFNANRKDIHRKYIYFDDEVVAINAWDENYKYINYRICITKPGISFLQEFARHTFYTDPIILKSGKLVNDGGNLGNPNLAKFKEKMNPTRIDKIYTLKHI